MRMTANHFSNLRNYQSNMVANFKPVHTSKTNAGEPRTEHYLFELAFDLAYFIHGNKETAFFIAEDALDGLPAELIYQHKNRKPSERLRGFWKWGERTRPVRKTQLLTEEQMLQWLVYRESQKWEIQTERGEGLYPISEEDLVIRYIEYLVFATMRNGSFSTTLAVCSLLHQFGRRETRLFYDVLTQSDSARMKDTNYIGKQRLQLLERVSARFNGFLRTERRAGDEKQYVMRPTTERVISLVTQSLQRFTPWGTTCVIKSGFDVTDIPDLYFLGNNQEEDLIEMNRVHTVLDPQCLRRFVNGLADYVQSLSAIDADKGCNFDLPDERIAVPQFFTFKGGPPPADRFQTPKLVDADYTRLERSRQARGRRRKSFNPHD